LTHTARDERHREAAQLVLERVYEELLSQQS
jgi:hypothetical protein